MTAQLLIATAGEHKMMSLGCSGICDYFDKNKIDLVKIKYCWYDGTKTSTDPFELG